MHIEKQRESRVATEELLDAVLSLQSDPIWREQLSAQDSGKAPRAVTEQNTDMGSVGLGAKNT
jgi:hypothetical protein